jgi:hypothetical protein
MESFFLYYVLPPFFSLVCITIILVIKHQDGELDLKDHEDCQVLKNLGIFFFVFCIPNLGFVLLLLSGAALLSLAFFIFLEVVERASEYVVHVFKRFFM